MKDIAPITKKYPKTNVAIKTSTALINQVQENKNIKKVHGSVYRKKIFKVGEYAYQQNILKKHEYS